MGVLHSEQPDHDELVERAKQGDHDAFGKLYAIHQKKTFNLCCRMVGNPAEAEDLVQESFLQLHRKLASFRGESKFTTWFHRLTINVVLMQVRKKQLQVVSLEETIEVEEGEIPHSMGSVDPHLNCSVERVVLERAIAQLPDGYRMIFVLHDVEGLFHSEIAELLKCAIGTSKSQLRKAKAKLRDILKNQPLPPTQISP